MAEKREIENLRPTTLSGLKRKAKRLKKSEGISLSEAQSIVAREMGYRDFRDARERLADGGE